MADQQLSVQGDESSDVEQFYKVEIESNTEETIVEEEVMEEEVMDGITVTLKDSTEEEDGTMDESNMDGGHEKEVAQEINPEDIITEENIEISEYQVTEGGQEIAVVYSSASEVPIIMSASDVGAAMGNQMTTVSQVEVVEEALVEEVPQEIVMTEVENLPQDVQATILNTIKGIKSGRSKSGDAVHQVAVSSVEEVDTSQEQDDTDTAQVMTEVENLPQDVQATILNTIEGIKSGHQESGDTVHQVVVNSVEEVDTSQEQDDTDTSQEVVEEELIVIEMPSRPETTSITTITRSEHTLDSLVPPQILATEDEPMATSPGGFSLVTLPHDVITTVTSQGSRSSQPVVENEDLVDVENEEASIAKFVPLSGDTMFDSPKSGSHGKARIVSISGSQMEVVPNFMEGSENDDMNNRDGVTLVKLTGNTMTINRMTKSQLTARGGNLRDMSESSTFQLTEAESVKIKDEEMTSGTENESGDSLPVVEGQIQISGGIALTPEDLAKLIAEGKLPADILKFVTTENRSRDSPVTIKTKGKKGKNEMLHGMQLLSECAMRMEEQEGQDEDGTQEAEEDTMEQTESQEEDQGGEQSQVFSEENVKEADQVQDSEMDEDSTNQLQLHDGSAPLHVVQLQTTMEDGQPGQTVVQIQATEYMQPPEQLVETQEAVVEGEEQLITTTGHLDHAGEQLQVHEVVNIQTEHGSKQVVVPVHVSSEITQQIDQQLNQAQHVIMDSQQISEDLIPMVQEEVILEIVEGEEIVVNTSTGNATIVSGMYGTDKATFLPIQNLTSSLLQQGLPSSHPVETYSQEILKQKKTKGKGKKRGARLKSLTEDEDSHRSKRRRLDSEPSTSSDGKLQKFQCHVCSKIFDRMKELRDHLLVHYNTKGYVCDFCNKSFSSSSHLRRHVMIHTGERPHKCDYCGEGFIQAVQLRVHKERHGHGPPPPLSRAPPKKGSKDGKREKKKKKKKKKKLQQDEKRERYKCSMCDATRKSKRKMKEHLKIHEQTRTFKCKTCQEAFINKNQLTIHEGRHKGKPELACAYCGKPFDTSSHLKRHERIHTGEKPYKCQFCDKAFIQGVQLRLHERIHTGERPHICSYCGKAFARSQYLKRHACIHTGEKPLKCRFCSERFIQPVQRQQHEKRLHKKKLKKMIAKKKLMQGQPPIKLVLRLKKKKKGNKDGDESEDLEDVSASESGSALSSDESS